MKSGAEPNPASTCRKIAVDLLDIHAGVYVYVYVYVYSSKELELSALLKSIQPNLNIYILKWVMALLSDHIQYSPGFVGVFCYLFSY